MSQRKKQLDLFPRRQQVGGATGKTKQYPRRPFPTIAALLIDPTARTIRTVYLRATRTGLKSIFDHHPVTFQDRDGYRAYGIQQDYHEITDRATLPGARLSIQGKTLITGPEFAEVFDDVSAKIMAGTTFSYSDAYQPQRLADQERYFSTHPMLSQNYFTCQ
jgi:hypothetical protein